MKRQKQIDFGKNTLGYDNYTRAVPKERRERSKRGGEHPVTPDKYEVTSKRAFDGRVKAWRRLLHRWDDVGPSPSPSPPPEHTHPSSAPPSPHPRHSGDAPPATGASACAGGMEALFGGGKEEASIEDEALALAAMLADGQE